MWRKSTNTLAPSTSSTTTLVHGVGTVEPQDGSTPSRSSRTSSASTPPASSSCRRSTTPPAAPSGTSSPVRHRHSPRRLLVGHNNQDHREDQLLQHPLADDSVWIDALQEIAADINQQESSDPQIKIIIRGDWNIDVAATWDPNVDSDRHDYIKGLLDEWRLCIKQPMDGRTPRGRPSQAIGRTPWRRPGARRPWTGGQCRGGGSIIIPPELTTPPRGATTSRSSWKRHAREEVII